MKIEDKFNSDIYLKKIIKEENDNKFLVIGTSYTHGFYENYKGQGSVLPKNKNLEYLLNNNFEDYKFYFLTKPGITSKQQLNYIEYLIYHKHIYNFKNVLIELRFFNELINEFMFNGILNHRKLDDFFSSKYYKSLNYAYISTELIDSDDENILNRYIIKFKNILEKIQPHNDYYNNIINNVIKNIEQHGIEYLKMLSLINKSNEMELLQSNLDVLLRLNHLVKIKKIKNLKLIYFQEFGFDKNIFKSLIDYYELNDLFLNNNISDIRDSLKKEYPREKNLYHPCDHFNEHGMYLFSEFLTKSIKEGFYNE